MSTLILDRFTCVVESDEAGDDSPYFVFFTGSSSAPMNAQLKTVRDPKWDNNVSDSNNVKSGATVATGVGSETLVLCALMEEDVNPDIMPGTAAFVTVQNNMRVWMQALSGSGAASAATLAGQLVSEFAKQLSSHTTNDEVLGVRRIPITALGTSFDYFGDGSHYRVFFRKTP
jgi:hypothetical protein